MRKLKDRLYTVSTLVPIGARVADIGCDHGHLPIYLIKEGISPFCIASDLKEKPLLSAKANIEKLGAKNIDTRLGAGLSTVKENEVDCIVIAGMGGEVIASILGDCLWLKTTKPVLILQPMTSADALRRYLCENGFTIGKEVACADSGKIYTVIKAEFSGDFSQGDECFYRIGKLDPRDPVSKKYIEKQLKILEKLISERKVADLPSEEFENTYRKISEVIAEDAD